LLAVHWHVRVISFSKSILAVNGGLHVGFAIEELPDVIRIIVLLNLSKGHRIQKNALKRRIDKVCVSLACIDMNELDKTLEQMASQGLLTQVDDTVQLTKRGLELGKEWESLLLKKDPILEIVAGLVDGSITGIVVILSAFIAQLGLSVTVFAAFLTLSAVAITNFSSFLLGGITEDLADIMTLQNLMNYSLNDIPDKGERDKSLMLVKRLFTVLGKEIHRSNLYAAIICGTTTFLAGSLPIVIYLILSRPFNLIVSMGVVAVVVGVFLVRYRSKKTRVHWKITLSETIVIVIIATIASLLLGGIA
jgi:VIT1/CCC1 family predicted Fe2+/Mn2+ transporter